MNNKDAANESGHQRPVHGSFPYSYVQPHYSYPNDQQDISRAYYYPANQPRSDSSLYGPVPHNGAPFHPMCSHPYSGSTRSDSHSSSLESHGSSRGGMPAYVANGSGSTFVPYPSQPGDHPFSTAPSHNVHSPVMVGPSPHPPYHGHYYTQWSAPVEYITEVKSIDVLSGRGGGKSVECSKRHCMRYFVKTYITRVPFSIAPQPLTRTVSIHRLSSFACKVSAHMTYDRSAGNRAFRELVKEYREKYLRAKKRDKPSVGKLKKAPSGRSRSVHKLTYLWSNIAACSSISK